MKHVLEIQDNQFQSEVIEQQGSVIVDFYGADCVICEAVAGWLDAMEDELTHPVRKVFLSDPTSPLAQAYHLRGIPTLIRFEDGIEQERLASQQITLASFREFILRTG